VPTSHHQQSDQRRFLDLQTLEVPVSDAPSRAGAARQVRPTSPATTLSKWSRMVSVLSPGGKSPISLSESAFLNRQKQCLMLLVASDKILIGLPKEI
jgi:hypothetical protein